MFSEDGRANYIFIIEAMFYLKLTHLSTFEKTSFLNKLHELKNKDEFQLK